MEHTFSALVLMGSAVAHIVHSRRKQALWSLNPSLAPDYETIANQPDPSLLFGHTKLERIVEQSKEHSKIEHWATPSIPERGKHTTNPPPKRTFSYTRQYNQNQFFRLRNSTTAGHWCDRAVNHDNLKLNK